MVRWEGFITHTHGGTFCATVVDLDNGEEATIEANLDQFPKPDQQRCERGVLFDWTVEGGASHMALRR